MGYEPNELPDCSTPRHFAVDECIVSKKGGRWQVNQGFFYFLLVCFQKGGFSGKKYRKFLFFGYNMIGRGAVGEVGSVCWAGAGGGWCVLLGLNGFGSGFWGGGEVVGDGKGDFMDFLEGKEGVMAGVVGAAVVECVVEEGNVE